MPRFALLALLATALAPAQTPIPPPLPLIPQPRELKTGPTQPLPRGLHIVSTSTDPDDTFTAAELTRSLTARRIPTTGPFTITLTRTQLPPEMQSEGYTITPTPSGLTLAAASPTGLFYATQTLLQLLQHDGPATTITLATIRDYPALPWRGMQDDLSRGPIPTLAFQKQLIRTLAAYKINLYSPYFEHTQQYTSNPLPAPPGGSITPAEAREITAYAAQFHVTVVPDQEAFGHLHHNLTWEHYSALAETPHGAVLAPGQPGSLAYITQIFTELAADYPGPFLHIGADETTDLGLGQTKADVDARGLGPVYLDFVQKIESALAPLHRRILFWGDIAQSITAGAGAYGTVGADNPNRTDPEILNKLPAAFKQNSIAVAWWYTPHPKNGFAPFLTPYTQAGIETWVAPGVNNWSSVWPNFNDALVNIQQFVAEGHRQHSTGVLTTTWYDDGEALANNNWYALLFGAAASWQPGTADIAAFQQAYGPLFHGDYDNLIDQAQTELMQCHEILRNQAKVGDGSDGLFWLDPWAKDAQTTATKIHPYTHDLRLHAEKALTLIAQARTQNPPDPNQTRQAGGAPGQTASSSDLGPATSPQGPTTSFFRNVSFSPHSPSFLSSRSEAFLSSRSEAEGSASGAATAFDPDPLPSNPTSLHHPEALDALELGARRLDFIGLKFQLADEIAQGYTRAQTAALSTNPQLHKTTTRELGDIRGINGKLEDILDTYALLRDLYQQAWLRSNRPYALRPILTHYDTTLALWQSRIDRFRTAQRQYSDHQTLPPAQDLGLPH